MNILVFIPCYNCSNEIDTLTQRLAKMDRHKHNFSYLFIDNNSSDNTLEQILESIKKYKIDNCLVFKNKKNYGVGGSHKIAFYKAIEDSYDFILVLHGDAQSDPRDIEEVLKYNILNDFSGILGSRFLKDSTRINYSFLRTAGNIIINYIYSFFLQQRISDLGSGLNFYSTKFLKCIDFESFSDEHNFSHYVLLSLIVRKERIHFFPIKWYQEEQKSNVNIFKIGLQSLSVLPKYILYRYKFVNEAKNTARKINREYDVKKLY
tara:strand:- start:7220 stop:8008 length:789 start_codon:yes stop_codon:yes gene_type:complete